MASNLSDYFTIGVSLVVIAIDDFNNKPICGNKLRVWIEGEKPAIQKQEGYYVFVNLRKKSFVLHVEGEIYHKQEILIDERKLKEYEQDILKVRMVPNRCYPLSADTTCVEGKAKPNSIILTYSEEYTNPYKLLYTYEKGSTYISVYHPNDINIEGKTLFMKNKNDTWYDFVQIEGRREDEEVVMYNIPCPLEHTYKKIGTILYPVYTIPVNVKGEFYFPIANIYAPAISFIFGIQEKEFRKKEIELTIGKVNRIDLTDL